VLKIGGWRWGMRVLLWHMSLGWWALVFVEFGVKECEPE
jgi:hypothetical protein